MLQPFAIICNLPNKRIKTYSVCCPSGVHMAFPLFDKLQITANAAKLQKMLNYTALCCSSTVNSFRICCGQINNGIVFPTIYCKTIANAAVINLQLTKIRKKKPVGPSLKWNSISISHLPNQTAP